jgi:hypothetical protein
MRAFNRQSEAHPAFAVEGPWSCDGPRPYLRRYEINASQSCHPVPSEFPSALKLLMFSSRWVNVPSMAWPALLALLAAIRSLLWSRAQLQAEVLALRHQLLVLKRQCAGRRVYFQTSDRVLWSWLSQLWPGWRQGLLLVRPETVVRWHRQGFRLYWRWKSRSRRPGRPPIEAEIRDLTLEIHRANPTWASSRI